VIAMHAIQELTPAAEARLQRKARRIVAQHNGDTFEALKALIVYAGYLEGQIKNIAATMPGLVSIGQEDMLRAAPPHTN